MSVKAKKRGRPSADKPVLSPERILEQAKLMMKEDGKVPSIRKLASSLEVDAMAIYYYFDNKAMLLESITVSLIEDIYDPCGDIQLCNWRAELQCLCKSYLELLQQYPGLLETLLTLQSVGPAQAFIERFNRVVKVLNLRHSDNENAIALLADYLHGYALALNCQQGSQLTVDFLNGPLDLYCLGLETKSQQSY